jgi:cysteine desulfurase / selenocysteine lyase
LNAVAEIRAQFPILNRKVNGNDLVYLDNAATTQKPRRVIEAMSAYYLGANANIHRGVHTLSRRATEMYEEARLTVASHFNVGNPQQVIFTAGATDSINLVAQGLAKRYLQPGDEIMVSTYEHHSNILPWQLWAEEHGGRLIEIPLTANESLDYGKIEGLITPRTKLIAVAHVSNTLGIITDLSRIGAIARKHGIPVMVDGAQSAPHMPVDLGELDIDFFACSAHKMYGPMGTGVLYLSARWLKELALSRTGGGTIRTVTFKRTEYAEGSLRLEPGTPNVAGAIGFAEALRFMADCGMDHIFAHEHELTQYTQAKLEDLPEVSMYGKEKKKAGVISFNVKGHHPFDVGTLLDKYGVAVRTGHHCTQPLMQCMQIEGTVRASFAIYNTLEEADIFVEKLKKAIKLLGK